MNRFGATVTAGALLLSLAACGSGTKPAASTTNTPLAPTSTPTPTPKADPTAAAKSRVLTTYAAFIVALDKGYREGGVTYRYDQYLTGKSLETVTNQITFLKGFHHAKVTGSSRLVESRISALSLSTKPQTATVTACIIDNLTAVSGRNGKTIAKPAGKLTRIDKLKLVKGKWMIYSTFADSPSVGCAK
ncbi:hypothetical protein ACFCV3_39800 [Kribbella sp. NPDC056345]|uniref:hypothetical protein n=1 Tax=Kribbella sp. NPDC056345 TaxID=3345789 RepID=UPI0035DB878D